jgi:hypothetical protein
VYKEWRFVWIWLELEFKLSMSFGLVQAMNSIHHPQNIAGELFWGSLAIFMMTHFRLGWLYIEDFIFGDIGIFKWFVIPDFYMPVILGVTVIYCLQIFYLGAPLEFKDGHVVGYELLNFKEHRWIYMAANIAYGIFHFYTAQRILTILRKE